MIHDLAIIGGGPAGVAAGVYAARKKLSSVFITKDIGGQSTVSPDIQNWIGTVSVSGDEFGKMLKKHLEAYAEDVLEINEGEWVKSIRKSADNDGATGFEIETDKNTYTARTVLITTGGRRRKLDIPGADEFESKGVMYCASCDGPVFKDMDVVVVGGGNAGFEAAAQLLAYCKSVTLLHRRDAFKADETTVEQVLKHPNMTALKEVEPTEITGEGMVNGVKYKNLKTGEEGELSVQGVFVEIGHIPNTGFAKDLLKIDDVGHIEVDARTQKTSTEGVWAAGDCANLPYYQNNIAAGDGVRALEDIYQYLSRNKK